jgi:hypothetical protein
MPGPPPKRSSQRRRRNKVEVDSAPGGGERGPELPGQHSAVGKRFWEALRRSGQSQFFEPSDWVAAELTVLAIDSFVKKPSAMMLASINSMMSNLLVTEADRRRLRLELERGSAVPEDQAVALLDEYRTRSSG